jgi:hypothetical protein
LTQCLVCGSGLLHESGDVLVCEVCGAHNAVQDHGDDPLNVALHAIARFRHPVPRAHVRTSDPT